MKRNRFIVILLFVLFIVPLNAEAALVVNKMRYGIAEDKVRIVLDVTDSVDKIELAEGFGNRIVLNIGKGSVAKEVKDIIVSDNVFRQAKLFMTKDGVLLDILLHQETQYKVFVLKNPNRLVIDILKDYNLSYENDVASGLKYTFNKQMQKGKMLQAHYVTIDKNLYDIKPLKAKNSIFGRDKLKNIATANNALAAINASYFATTGWVIGNLKINSEIVGMENTPRTAFLALPDKKYELGLINFEGEVILPNGEGLSIKGVNRERLTNDLVLYESSFIKSTGTNEHGREITIDEKGIVININVLGNSSVNKNTYVISGHGIMADKLAQVKIGDKIILKQTMGTKADKAFHVVGAGPRLLADGVVVTGQNNEQFLSDITNGRAPRSAIGIMKDGKIIFYVVDGRSSLSAGMTLSELANALKEIGVVDAMNLDGGGSSEIIVNNEMKNSPSDGAERSISVALGVFRR